MTLRRATALALLTAILLSSLVPLAGAYEGTSLFDNIAPPTQSHGKSEDYPLSSYGLDSHPGDVVGTADTPILPDVVPEVDTEALGAGIVSEFTDIIFTIHRWLAAMTLTLFDFAWSFDLIHIALQPIRQATMSLYNLLGGDAFMIVVVCVGCWAAVRTFRGAIASTVAQLGLSAVFILVCLFLIFNGGRFAEGVSRTVNGLSPGLLAAVTGGGSETNADDAHESAKDVLHDLMIHRIWMVMQFGGLSHCVDKDGKLVKNPFDPDCRTKVSHETYARLYLKAGEPGGKGRKLVYQAIKEGKNPTADQIEEADVPDDLFAGVTLSAKDKAGVDMQQGPAVLERFGGGLLALIGGIGLDVLIGGLSASVIVAQAVFLLLLMLAVVVMFAAAVPRVGHTIFHEYLGKLFFTGTRKLWNTLILALAVALLSAIHSTAPQIGILAALGIACLFSWALVFARDDIYDRMQQALSGRAHHEQRRLGEHARDVNHMRRAAQPLVNTARGTGIGAAGLVYAGAYRAADATAGASQKSADGIRHGTGVLAAGSTSKNLVRGVADQAAGRELLEADRQKKTRQLREEQARRARVSELQQKEQQAARSPHTSTSGAALGAFSARDRRELAQLQSSGMSPDVYKRTSREVTEAARRERKTGDPFTPEQVAAATRQARDNAARRTREAPEKTAEKARNWAATHDRIFGDPQRGSEWDAADRDIDRARARSRPSVERDWNLAERLRLGADKSPPGTTPPDSGAKPGTTPPPKE